MTIFKIPVAALGIAILLSSCDEGKIYPETTGEFDQGAEVRMIAKITGEETWPEGYTLSLAAFAAGDEYALVSRNIQVSKDDEETETILSNIPENAATVEVCVLDRIRRRVATFESIDFNPEEASAKIRAEEIDMAMQTAIQNEILSTTCANCHGGANFAAAGLNLTQGHSFNELIGVESIKEPGKMRVSPGDAAGSVLYEILTTESSATWNYDHSKEIYDPVKLDLIKNWIQSL